MREEAFRVRRKERKVKGWRKGKEKERPTHATKVCFLDLNG
jgi:hypothetical protein